jgi:UDP-glucose:tetrahydrobiopterin glucosyltransferase
MTHHWVEAFGNVTIEALACGVPVITYDRGGPAEIVQPGSTGWLVPPDDVAALAAAIQRIDDLDRSACRRQAEAEYSLPALGDRFEAWFNRILHRT